MQANNLLDNEVLEYRVSHSPSCSCGSGVRLDMTCTARTKWGA